MKTLTLTTILALAAAFAGGCSINPATGAKELILIPESQEIALGTEAAPEFEKEFGGAVPNEQLQSYVSQIGLGIAAKSDRPQMPYEFKLLASDVPNAFALPGGKIFVTAGLMGIMTNERELAAVIAHEIGHVNAKHNVHGMQRQMGASVLVELAGWAAGSDKGQAAEAAAKVVTGMANLRYSRSDEYESDKLGIIYMTRAGYNPYGMVELLTALSQLGQEGGSLSEMFQTHPLTSKRIEEAGQEIENQGLADKYSASDADPNAARFKRMQAMLK